jgi:hypothetical protein
MNTPVGTPRESAPGVPLTCELFSRKALVERRPNLLTKPRVQWALRNRAKNGLAYAAYESRSGCLLVHEPEFLQGPPPDY